MTESAIVIHKYTLPLPGADVEWIQYEFPEGTRILAVQEQYNKPCLWTLSPAEEAKKNRRFFRIFATGKVYRGDLDKLEYVGTAILNDGAYVAHIFERKE